MTLTIRHDWTTEEIQALLELPLMQLLWQAQTVHREANPGYRVQLASLLSVKTGGCEEDCAYCSQSIHNSSDVTAFEAQMQVEPVLQRARAAKEAGADRFCMGWAWREIRDGAPFEAMLEMVRGVRGMGMEACVTAGMLTDRQAERLAEAGYIHIGMDHFARPDDPLVSAFHDGTLHRNFQGYSTHAECDLIGVGVSAISHIGDSYSQNTKLLSEYQDGIDAGEFPIDRGLALSRDDKIRQSVIERLMCAGEVDLDEVSAEHRPVPEDYFRDDLERLQTLLRDDLITFPSARIIRVTAKGRFLLRNICMIFDRYIEPTADIPRHSRVI